MHKVKTVIGKARMKSSILAFDLIGHCILSLPVTKTNIYEILQPLRYARMERLDDSSENWLIKIMISDLLKEKRDKIMPASFFIVTNIG